MRTECTRAINTSYRNKPGSPTAGRETGPATSTGAKKIISVAPTGTCQTPHKPHFLLHFREPPASSCRQQPPMMQPTVSAPHRRADLVPRSSNPAAFRFPPPQFADRQPILHESSASTCHPWSIGQVGPFPTDLWPNCATAKTHPDRCQQLCLDDQMNASGLTRVRSTGACQDALRLGKKSPGPSRGPFFAMPVQ